MMVYKIALKNLLSAGVRTWLTAFVLSLTLASMIFLQALMTGMLDEMSTIRAKEEISQGQIWHPDYDPYDLTQLDQANGAAPSELLPLITSGELCPLLLIPGAVYPKGRFRNLLIKGVDPAQSCLDLDFSPLGTKGEEGLLSVMIGARFAKSLGLKQGDLLTVRWRSKAGAFDALDAQVVAIFHTQAPVMDMGQIYLSHDAVNQMNGTLQNSTFFWVNGASQPSLSSGWTYKSFNNLMADTLELVKSKQAGQSIFYGMLLLLGLIAVFDTQALAVFRRKKEIGTFMALGMSNAKVVYLFVVEGAMHGVLATALTALWAGPLFWWASEVGISFGEVSGEEWGMAFGDRFYPVFGFVKVMGAVLFVNLMVVFVSFWPTRVITKMLPANALRGRLS